MRQAGQLANPLTPLVERLIGCLLEPNGRKQRARLTAMLAKPASELPPIAREPLRPRQGALQEAILTVLEMAGEPVTPRQLREAAERLLGHAISPDTVTSLLSVGARSGSSPVTRVGLGQYVFSPPVSGSPT